MKTSLRSLQARTRRNQRNGQNFKYALTNAIEDMQKEIGFRNIIGLWSSIDAHMFNRRNESYIIKKEYLFFVEVLSIQELNRDIRKENLKEAV